MLHGRASALGEPFRSTTGAGDSLATKAHAVPSTWALRHRCLRNRFLKGRIVESKNRRILVVDLSDLSKSLLPRTCLSRKNSPSVLTTMRN
jgi:hypothetical protein